MFYPDYRDTVNDWLADTTNEDQPPVLDNSGRCLVVAEEQVALTICVPDALDRVYLYADVLAVPEERSADFYEQLLAYNVMPEVSLGLVLAFDRDARFVVASYSTEIACIDTVDFPEYSWKYVQSDLIAALEIERRATRNFRSA